MTRFNPKHTDGYLSGTMNVSCLTLKAHDYLLKKGMRPHMLPKGMCSVTVQHKGKILHGFGIKNDFGGVEFCSENSLDTPVSLSTRGIIFVPYKARCTAHTCNMFADFLDYLSFKTFQEHSVMTFPANSDSIVINHPVNFLHAMIKSDVYDNINLFMPNNAYGRTITLSIIHRNPRHTTDCSAHYQSYEHFRDFVHSLMSRKEGRWI